MNKIRPKTYIDYFYNQYMFKIGDYVTIKTETWDIHHGLTGTIVKLHNDAEQYCTVKLDKESVLEIERRCKRINQTFYIDFKYPTIASSKLFSDNKIIKNILI